MLLLHTCMLYPFFLVKSVSTLTLFASGLFPLSFVISITIKLFSPSLFLFFIRFLHYYDFCCLLAFQYCITTIFLNRLARPPQLRCELFPSIYLPYIHRVIIVAIGLQLLLQSYPHTLPPI